MLTRLEIRDFALIEHALIQPGEGLNIITGETGAGKSILIDALGAVAGSRIGKDIVRSGRDKAVVEAVFRLSPGTLPESLVESLGLDGDEIYLSREVTSAGKNTARLNGRLVPAGILREIGSQVLDIHGQFDNQSIFNPEMHLSLLDRYGGPGMAAELEAYTVVHRDHAECIRRIADIGGDPGERERRLDTLRFQLDEIRSHNPRPGEDEALTAKRRIAANMTHILEALQKSHMILDGDEETTAMATLSAAEAALAPAASAVSDAAEALEAVREARFSVEGAAVTLRRLLDTIEDDPAELERIDRRLDILFRLKRKYGGTLDAVLAHAAKAEAELALAEQNRDRLEDLEKKRSALLLRLEDMADALHARRAELADGLSDRICRELAALDMKNVRFDVRINRLEGEGSPGRKGSDQVEFL
ncbi:MAG: AAA family ATPase, partial [Clostridia bacterium]|nr:AAA family ATPase [Clostridia bacterium]